MAAGTPEVVCLCAAWCRLCDCYAPVVSAVVDDVAAQHLGLRLRWVDIEDEADLVGDLDVETFPTLVIVDAAGRVRFAGPVTPQAETLRRLLRAALDEPGAAGTPVTPEVLAFAQRLRAQV